MSCANGRATSDDADFYNPKPGSRCGSGVIIKSEEGIHWIVTNYHVIKNRNQNRTSIRVEFKDNTSVYANDVKSVPEKDLAYLCIYAPEKKLRPMPMGVSADLLPTQEVAAIGHPAGLKWTYTQGVISHVERDIKSPETGHLIERCIQTDAAINPGNSGGPLLDKFGKLIGINTQIRSCYNESCGLGFAIPIETVQYYADKLLTHEALGDLPLMEKTTIPSRGHLTI